MVSASYTTGHEFNRGIFKTFGNSQMEDFWLEFYCNTTNISKSRSEIHTSGYVWRYVRASMSLAGLLPPLCDNGSMLLDGGYIDNLTVTHMKSLGADVIFAVDVGSLDDNAPQALATRYQVFGQHSIVGTHCPATPILRRCQKSSRVSRMCLVSMRWSARRIHLDAGTCVRRSIRMVHWILRSLRRFMRLGISMVRQHPFHVCDRYLLTISQAKST
jgi:predicted acylesterase/phospholipase RssA